jgi:hypothetical protein
MAKRMTTASDFTLAGYGDLLTRFLDVGYRICSFAEANVERADLVLRHDVDMSPAAALEMAEFEARRDVSAAYFVLLRSPLYNLLTEENTDFLRQILALGHDVGLHFDAALYEGEITVLNQAAEVECTILEEFLGRRVELISLHRPQPVLLGYGQPIAGRIHSYQPKFFSEMGYCSDSRGGWHHGHPFNHVAVAERRAMQLLTHPIWWIGAYGPPEEKLHDFIEISVAKLDIALAEQCDTHRAGAVRIITGGQG